MKPCFLALALALPSAQAAVYAHYSFDADCTDSSGNARDGTLVEGLGIPTTSGGGAPAGTPGNSGIITTAGDYKFGGGAVTFSTDRDYVSLPQITIAPADSYTIAFWARVAAPVLGEAATATTFDLAIGDRSDTNNFIALGQASTSRFRGVNNTTGQLDFKAAGVGNDWHHYVITASGGSVSSNTATITIYYDGAFLTSGTGKKSEFLIDTIGEAYNVNTTSNDFDFHGEIDEVWILDDAVDATTVNNIYTLNAVPEPSALLLLGAGGFLLLGGRSRAKA